MLSPAIPVDWFFPICDPIPEYPRLKLHFVGLQIIVAPLPVHQTSK